MIGSVMVNSNIILLLLALCCCCCYEYAHRICTSICIGTRASIKCNTGISKRIAVVCIMSITITTVIMFILLVVVVVVVVVVGGGGGGGGGRTGLRPYQFLGFRV